MPINILKKLINKWVIIGIIILVIIILFSNGYFKKEQESLKTEKVVRGTLIQEVSETGMVKPTKEVSLAFKTAGRISKVNVKVGDIVEKGAELASLDTAQLFIQLNQAKASLEVAEVQYNKTSQSAKNTAQQDLNNDYQDALNVLDDAYLKIYNAYNVVVSLQNSYFGISDQEGIKIQDNKLLINNSLNTLKSSLDAAKISLKHNDIENALLEADNSLKNTSLALKNIREVCDLGVYYSKVASSDKTAVDNQRSYIITALTNINNSQ